MISLCQVRWFQSPWAWRLCRTMRCQVSANELTGTGIRVNAVCPGLVETGMTKGLFDLARARGTSGKVCVLCPDTAPTLQFNVNVRSDSSTRSGGPERARKLRRWLYS